MTDWLSSERFAALVRHSSDVIAVTDAEGKILYVSPAADRVLGWPAEDQVGKSPADFVHPDDAAELAARRKELLAVPGVPVTTEVRTRTADGGYRWVQITATNLLDDPVVRGVVSTVRPIDEHRQMVEQLRSSEERLRAVLDASPDLIVRYDRELRHVYVNHALEALGISPELVLGRRHRDLPGLPEGVAAQWEAALRRVFDTGEEEDVEIAYDMPSGRRWFWSRLAAERLPGGEVDHVVAMARDVTARRWAEERAAFAALHDVLTGLPNRALLTDRLELLLARRERTATQVVVLFLDLDHFKWVNDTLGHATGDAVLTAVAERLTGSLRPGDTVARLGGDEFVVTCEVEDEHVAVELAERVLEDMRRPLLLAGREVPVTVSLGMAVAGPGATPESLLRDADAAMYEAKRRGRDRRETMSERLHVATTSRLTLQRDLRRAIDGGELQMAFLPVVNLADGEIVGVEAVPWWEHPDRGLLRAEEFVPLAEGTTVVLALGQWVVFEACRAITRWRGADRRGHFRTVWIGLSARQLVRSDVVAAVLHGLEESACPDGGLGVTVSESVLLDETEGAADALASLHDAGVRLAAGDFGSGSASFTSLRRLPLELVRVDMSLVAGVDRDPASAAVVSSVVTIAHALGRQVLAAGVEEEGQLAVLRRLGCDAASGPHLYPLLAEGDVEELLTRT